MGFQRMGEELKGAPNEITEELKSLSKVIDDSATEVRAISHQLMPKVLIEFGLAPALDDMLEKSLGLAGIKYSFETFGNNERYYEQAELGLYRICQEAINNILKHANATEVSVQLLKAGGNLVMMIEDNGKGANFNTTNTGHGITNMQSRARTIGADISFDSAPGKGTVINVRMPLQ